MNRWGIFCVPTIVVGDDYTCNTDHGYLEPYRWRGQTSLFAPPFRCCYNPHSWRHFSYNSLMTCAQICAILLNPCRQQPRQTASPNFSAAPGIAVGGILTRLDSPPHQEAIPRIDAGAPRRKANCGLHTWSQSHALRFTFHGPTNTQNRSSQHWRF